jgi:DNA-binding response OmpR family regulator
MNPESDTHARPHVLVVEDEPPMQFLLADNLDFAGYRVTTAGSAEAALDALQRYDFSLIVLDVMLPGMSGFEFCRRLRAAGIRIPIVMLTARNEEADRIAGLDLGADDYVSKPFAIKELLARIRAQLRRTDSESRDSGEIVFGDVVVNTRRRVVTRDGKEVRLSAREFELLRYLIAHRGEVVSREQLLRDVWGYQHVMLTRTVDNFIAKLRMQLEPTPHEPRYLVTVHGTGYEFLN